MNFDPMIKYYGKSISEENAVSEYYIVDGCKVKVNYLPERASAGSRDLLDGIKRSLLASSYTHNQQPKKDAA